MEYFTEFYYNGKTLMGVFHTAEVESHTYVMIIHGIPGDRVDTRRMNVKIARRLAENGVHCLRVDFLASGISEGDYVDVSYSGLCDQITFIAEQLCAFDPTANIILLAFSEAGKIVLQVMSKTQYLKKAILCNGVLEGYDNTECINLKRAWKKGKNILVDLGYGVWINANLLKEKCSYSLLELANTKTIIGIYGTGDILTEASRLALIAANIKVIDIPGADHLFTNKEWEDQVITYIVTNICIGE